MVNTYQQAVGSENADFVKQVRTSFKGKLTRALTAFKCSLSVKKSGDSAVFDHGKIEHAEVVRLIDDVKAFYEQVSELHTRYEVIRDHNEDETEEAKLVEVDNTYISEIESKVRAALKQYDSYLSSIEAIETVQASQEISDQYKADLKAFKVLSAEYESCCKAAQDVVGSEDDTVLRTAEHFKKELEAKLKQLEAAGNKLELLGVKTEAEVLPSDKESFNCCKEKLAHSSIIAQLEKAARVIEHKDNIEVAKVTKPTEVKTEASKDSSEKSNLLKLKIKAPTFSGKCREFAVFRRDFETIVAVDNRSNVEIGALLKESIPQKHRYLLDKVELSNHKEMMSILVAKFGRARIIVDECTAEIRNMKIITTDKEFISFVEHIDKLKRDLEQLNLLSDIANTTVIADLESKLPYGVKRDWIKLVSSKEFAVKAPSDIFKGMLEFFEETKIQAEYHSTEIRSQDKSQGRASTNVGFVCGVSNSGSVISGSSGKVREPPRKENKPCLACADGATDLRSAMHPTGSCAVWQSLSMKEKKEKVNCVKCPFNGKDCKHHTSECKKTKLKCHNCLKEDDHHTWFCFKPKAKTNTTLTKASISGDTILPPVMTKTLFVSVISQKSNNSGKMGAMFDDCSTDHYITHTAAKKYGFHGDQVELVVEGIGGVEQTISTWLYKVHVLDKTGKSHEYFCYGLDKIATADNPTKDSYDKICTKFGIKLNEVRRPKEIELMIALRASAHHPDRVKSIGHMSLYNGIYGKCFGGTDLDLVFFQKFESAMPTAIKEVRSVTHSKTLRAVVRSATASKKLDKEILDLLMEDNIGVNCVPKCGGCQCGQCPVGDRPMMSLKDEREYKKLRDNLTLDIAGTEDDPGPYWRTKLPWKVDRHEMVDNKAAVIAVMNSTKRKLKQDPSWEDIYESQLKDLIDRKVAREVSQNELDSWIKNGGKVYYMPHQMAVNPMSKTTPVRVVFNNTLCYKGYSINNSIDEGPDILTNLHGLLLRFRSDIVAAAGDIKKMFYCVRVAKEDEFMQIFIWRWKGEEKLRYFAMTRLVMGTCPSTSISGVAVNETANLEDYNERYPAAYNALAHNSYVDNTMIMGPSLEKVKADIKETEFVAAKGGFFYKEWVISGQKVGDQVIAVHVPNQIAADQELALGINWNVEGDTFCIKVDVTKHSKKIKKKNQHTVTLTPSNQVEVKPHLTLRACLSIHAKAYDPLGLTLPTKMKGSLLMRLTIQVLKKELHGPIPWDQEISGDLCSRWSEYFEMLVSLELITFPRSFKPDNVNLDILPILIIFSDGNEQSFGTVGYAIWTLMDRTRECRLIMSRSKLSAILKKGEPFRNELNGGVYNARLKEFICKHTCLVFGQVIHLLDSRIVQYMIQKTSYGYGTFVGLRVGEIQQKTNPKQWYHIASEENIADILTKGASTDKLGPGSVWQCGPKWLVLDQENWPVTTPDQLKLRDEEISLEKSCRVKSVCNTSKSVTPSQGPCPSIAVYPFLHINLDAAINHATGLKKLIRTVALVMRAKLSDSRITSLSNADDSQKSGKSVLSKIEEISASEYRDAWLYLLEHEQQQRLDTRNVLRLVPVHSAVKLENYDYVVKLTVIGGRVKNFPIRFNSQNSVIPILPASTLGKLVVRFYHNKFHKEPDTIVAHVRSDVWVINCRKMATSIDSKCKICIIGRNRRAEQVMGDLPSVRSTDVAPAWSAVNMDLFGPLLIRDECVKRGPRVVKKVWGVAYCCTRTRGVYLDIATDYSTESILHTVRRLQAVKGQVSTIISDCGSQLQGADKELRDWRLNWDSEMLKRFGCDKGIDWTFVMPYSKHQNGAVEIMIKLIKGIKRSLMKALGDSKLTYNEMNTLFLEIAQLCNERPIGLRPNESTDPEYLSPNSLYLGRTSDRIAAGPFASGDMFEEEPKSFISRFYLVQAITTQFWKVWVKLYFPSLLVRQKWHTAKRNLRVGDVCMLQDPTAFRGEWRLVVVNNVYPDGAGIVRNVEVRAKPKQNGSLPYIPSATSYLKRHVSNLVVLVPVEDSQSDLDSVKSEKLP